MKIEEVLSPENVVLGFSAPPGKVLDALVDLARLRAVPGPEAAAFREEELHLLRGLAAEGLGLFHNLSERTHKPLLLLALAPEGVQLAEGGPPVRVLALLLSPIKESGTHLQLLAKLTSLLRSRRLQDELLARRTPQEVLRALRLEEEAGPENYWVLSRQEVFEELQTSERGLSEEEAARRLAETGPNVIQRARRQPLYQRFLSNFVNLFALLLWAATALSYASGATELAIAIPVVILVNAVFSFLQEYRAERAIEALEKLLPPHVKVMRDGTLRELEATLLVPGDVVVLEAGDQVAADARLIDAHDFRVDNSVLTGESRPSYKFDEPVEDGRQFLWIEMPNVVFAGTAALSGHAQGVVIATGMNTQLGHIAALTQAVREEPSPLQRQMQGVARFVAAAAFSVGLLFFAIAVLTGKLTVAASLIFAIGIITAFVPEGLLPTLSLSLAIAVQRMAAKRALVKRLSSVETLGAATVICSDKTGTLTTNEMMVQRMWVEGGELEATGIGYEPRGDLLRQGETLDPTALASPLLDVFCRCAALCSTSDLVPPNGGRLRWHVRGDPTEGALLTLAAKAGRGIEAICQEGPRLKLFPFDSVRKRMTSVNSGPEGSVACWVKGAPEGLLPLCSHITTWDGGRRPLSPADRTAFIGAYNDFATHGLRILALAWKEVPSAEGLGQDEAESGLTLIGVAGMIDPPRAEAPGAIVRCHQAGIRIIMITGDYGPTAAAIAAQVGMQFKGHYRPITADQLSAMSDVRLKALLRRGGELVFARSAPEDKLRIVRLLRDLGEVVAVTGDGVNDAPALKQAAIGVAMGIRGTEVSREAAAMVLADDNFASIVAAIEEGRAVYSNIKKFITYVFASNLAEAVPFILFIFAGLPLPLLVMQILAVDLGADLLPALALGAEPPEPGTMTRPPRRPGTPLIDLALIRRSLYAGAFVSAAGMGGYFFSNYLSGWRPGLALPAEGLAYARATTMCWAGIIAAQAGNAMAMRTERESVFSVGLFANPLVWPGLLSMAAVIALLSNVGALQRFFHTAPLRWPDVLYLVGVAVVVVAAEELRKFFVRRRSPLEPGR